MDFFYRLFAVKKKWMAGRLSKRYDKVSTKRWEKEECYIYSEGRGWFDASEISTSTESLSKED
jgi:hypothetical protein